MKILSIDIETYSSEDLRKVGVYKYTEIEDFEILLFGYAFNDEKVEIVDIAQGESIPKNIKEALNDDNIIKTAFNANFEIVCLNKFLKMDLNLKQWRCSAVKSTMLGFPNRLEEVARVLRLEEQKDTRGKQLIRYFSMPCKPTKSNNGRIRNLPHHDLKKWEEFKSYCKKDVEVEREIRKKLSFFVIPQIEEKIWETDQKINKRGVKIDIKIAKNAIKMFKIHKENLIKRGKEITKLENPNSVEQLKKWILNKTGKEVESLTKNNMEEILETIEDKKVKEMIKIRKELGKTSIKKYNAMVEVASKKDERARGLLQYYGAGRTGRWAGRLIQIQNLPQNHIKAIKEAREVLRIGDYELLEMIYPVTETISELVRTAFIPSEGARFIVADYSAIEARIIAWLTNEKWRIEVFETHGKIYEASASKMFKVPIETITKGSSLRQKGKCAELALGYQGGVGALINIGALKMGIAEEELLDIVNSWRGANKNIVDFWHEVEKNAIYVVKNKSIVKMEKGITLLYNKGILFIKLPSGRSLSYPRVRIGTSKFGRDCIQYEGVCQNTKKWSVIDTYGGKITENIVQAIARDCLANAIINLEEEGYKVVMHIHDEVVLDVEKDKGSIEEVNKIMERQISWAKDLLLKVEGYETDFYMKD